MQVWFYLLPMVGGSESKLLGERVYPGLIEDLQLNASHAAVLTGGELSHAEVLIGSGTLVLLLIILVLCTDHMHSWH